jgi:hypothetical protein
MAIEIKIGASFNDRDIKRAQRELDNLSRVADKMSQSVTAKMARTGESFSRLGQTLTTNLSLPLMALGALSVKAFTEQEDAIAKMESVLRSTGGVAGVTSKHITDLASSLQETTTFADEVTVNGAALLLTFKQVRNEFGAGNDVFDRTIKAGQDMSMVLGKDLNSSMMMLGKALNDPEKGLSKLSRAGVQFTREQEHQIKVLARSGDVLGAQKIMLAELESQFGGAAEAMAKTAGGRLKAAMNQLGEAGEAIGAEIAPVLATVATSVANLVKKFGDLPGPVRTIVVALGALAAATGPVIWGTGIMLTNLATIGKTKLGTAVIDGFNSLRTAIANAVTQAGSLRAAIAQRLTPAMGLAAVAVVGLGIGLNELNKKFVAEARSELSGLTGDLSALRVAMLEAVQTGRIIGPLSKVTEAFAMLRGEAEELNDRFFGERHGQFNPFESLRSFFTDTGEKADEARAAIANVDVALTEMFRVDPAGAERLFGMVMEMASAAGFSVEEVSAMLPSYTSLADAAANSTNGFAGAFGDVEDEITAAEQALKDWADTVKAQFDPVFAYQDAVGDQADAVKALADAQDNVNDVVAQFGPGSAEAQEALRQLNTAEQNLILTTGDLDAKQRGLLEGVKSGDIPLADAIGTIQRLGAEHGLTAEQIQGQIDKFNWLAYTVLTTDFGQVTIPVNSNAAEVLDYFQRLSATVKAFNEDPNRVIDLARFFLSNGLPGRAAGGPVTAGMPHMVGERGRELFIPSTDGVIVPHYESRRMLSDSDPATTGPQTTNNVVNVTVNKTEASPYEIGRELLWAMKVAG